MEDQLRLRYIRHTCSVQGWALLIYMGIMNVAVLVVTFLGAILQVIAGNNNLGLIMESSGWGYFLAIGIGAMVLVLWKKWDFWGVTLCQTGKPMKLGRFLAILSVFLSVQMLSALLSVFVDWIMWNLGLEANDMGVTTIDSLSMFLYVGLGAPISEEILFRGLVLRSLEPFGKKFAIFTSALLFGLFHGNLSQAPFAFGAGLVMAYVALEYNIFWAMLLHMINNLILSDTLYRLLSLIPGGWGPLILWGIIGLFTVAAVVVLIVRRNQIGAYLRQEYDDPFCFRAFFSAPGIITLLVILILSMVVTTLLSFVPIY